MAVRLEVYIQPRASKTELAGAHDGAIKIRIAAPAVENAANRALIEFIAQQLGVAKYACALFPEAPAAKKYWRSTGRTARRSRQRCGKKTSVSALETGGAERDTAGFPNREHPPCRSMCFTPLMRPPLAAATAIPARPDHTAPNIHCLASRVSAQRTSPAVAVRTMRATGPCLSRAAQTRDLCASVKMIGKDAPCWDSMRSGNCSLGTDTGTIAGLNQPMRQ